MAKSSTHLKLVYFDAAGRAEPIRYLFAAAEMVYEDCRIKGEQWPSLKSETPFGSLPILEVTTGKHTVKIGQSLAVGRFVAKLTGLYGTSPIDQGKIDAIVDFVKELGEDSMSVYAAKDKQEEKEERIKEYIERSGAKLKLLSKMVNEKYFVGNKLSWADIFFYGSIDFLKFLGVTSFLDGHPKLQAVCDAVEKQHGIAKYITKRDKDKK